MKLIHTVCIINHPGALVGDKLDRVFQEYAKKHGADGRGTISAPNFWFGRALSKKPKPAS